MTSETPTSEAAALAELLALPLENSWYIDRFGSGLFAVMISLAPHRQAVTSGAPTLAEAVHAALKKMREGS